MTDYAEALIPNALKSSPNTVNMFATLNDSTAVGSGDNFTLESLVDGSDFHLDDFNCQIRVAPNHHDTVELFVEQGEDICLPHNDSTDHHQQHHETHDDSHDHGHDMINQTTLNGHTGWLRVAADADFHHNMHDRFGAQSPDEHRELQKEYRKQQELHRQQQDYMMGGGNKIAEFSHKRDELGKAAPMVLATQQSTADGEQGEIVRELDPSPELEICTLTHSSTLVLPKGYRIDLRELALAIPVGGEAVGDVIGARFAPPVGDPVERGAAGFVRRAGKKDFGNQLQLRLRAANEARVQVKVFSTGALATTGARTEADAISAVVTVAACAKHAGIPVGGHGPVELRNALCTGFVGAQGGVWDVDAIFAYAQSDREPGVAPHHIKARGRAAILEVGEVDEEGHHAPRCIVHPSGAVQVMGKVTPAVAQEVYTRVRMTLERLLMLKPGSLRRRTNVKKPSKPRRGSAANTPSADGTAEAHATAPRTGPNTPRRRIVKAAANPTIAMQVPGTFAKPTPVVGVVDATGLAMDETKRKPKRKRVR